MRKKSFVEAKKDDAVSAMRELAAIMKKLPEEYDFFFHPGKHLFFMFLKGVVYGLGFITAIAIIIPLVISLLRGIEWVPLVGDFVSNVATQMESARGR